MPEDRWERREQVLLEAIAEAEDRGESPDTNSLAAATGLDSAEAGRRIRRLMGGDYVSGYQASTFGNQDAFIGIGLKERGLRAVGEWPAEDCYDTLIQILEHHIETAATPEERNKYEQLRDGVIGVGRDVLTSVSSALARQAGGLS